LHNKKKESLREAASGSPSFSVQTSRFFYPPYIEFDNIRLDIQYWRLVEDIHITDR